jgi:hypothetical protein
MKIMSELRLKIKGRVSHSDCTLGRLSYGDYQCFTLELPWLDNKPNVSCIPRGVYQCKKIVSPSLGECINIQGVFGRTYIRIHKGNFTKQIQGCILVGTSIQFIDGDSIPDVGASATAFNGLMDVLPNSFLMEIGL